VINGNIYLDNIWKYFTIGLVLPKNGRRLPSTRE